MTTSIFTGFKAFVDPYIGFIRGAAVIALGLGIFYAGIRINEAKHLKQQAKAVEQALITERSLQDQNNEWTSDYINRLNNQLGAARALPKIKMVNDCPVPADVGGVLNDAQRLHPDASTGPGAGSTRTSVDSTCATELDIAKRNYAEVCVPNANQLTEVQERWKKVRAIINQQK